MSASMNVVDPNTHPARALLLTPRAARRYCDGVTLGLPHYSSCARANMPRRTADRYLARGRAAHNLLDQILTDLDDTTLDTLNTLDAEAPDPTDTDNWPPLSPRDTAMLDLLPAGDRVYWRFWREVEKAWANFEARNIGLVQEAASGYDVEEIVEEYTVEDGARVLVNRTVRKKRERSWQAAMTLLERRIPDRWAQTRRHEITGASGGPLEVSVEGTGMEVPPDLTDDEQDAYDAEVLVVLRSIPGALPGVDPIEDAEVIDDDDSAAGPRDNGDAPAAAE